VALVVGALEGKLRTLIEVGTFIWEFADGKHTLSEIVNLMRQEFEVDFSTALRGRSGIHPETGKQGHAWGSGRINSK
jgi:hypothetical protein